MRIRVLAVPYDSGRREERMGRGPEHILRHGLERALETHGHELHVEHLAVEDPFPTEVGTTFALYRLLGARVASARAEGAFPLVLAGNCGSAVGAAAGLGPEGLGLAWFDGHGEFNTPETTLSGFLDGMGLAIATGRAWRAIAGTIPGFRPLPEDHVMLVGARDLDAEERLQLERSHLAVVADARLRREGARAALGPAVEALATGVCRAYIHVDLDVLDPHEAPANHLAPPGGLTLAQLQEAIALIGERVAVCGAGLASYDPSCDPEGRALAAALDLAVSLAANGRL